MGRFLLTAAVVALASAGALGTGQRRRTVMTYLVGHR